jgi:hypothetical protein
MRASSVFSASCRYIIACCRKYSSQSMFRRATQGHERSMSGRLMEHTFQPCARGRMTAVAAAVAATTVWEPPASGFYFVSVRWLLLNVFATSA